MIRIIGVRFRNVGKIYYFRPMDLEIKRGDHVIVETARGLEYGKVVLPPHEVTDDSVTQPLRETIRVATEQDREREERNRQLEKDAFKICQKKIHEHGLEMKLIDAEYTFDNNKVLFYFTADGRVDFRELVKDLAGIFRTRIELRQIGVRDETKILGGIGICGRPLCCSIYLSEFAPVSIKMAKEQNLSLNPTKISGSCGRLMCCLKNEQETYEYLNRKMPRMGDGAITSDGEKGVVIGLNILRQNVRILFEKGDEKQIMEYAVEDLEIIPKAKRLKMQQEKVAKAAEEGETSAQKPEESRPEKKKREKKEKKPEVNEDKNPEKTAEKNGFRKNGRKKSGRDKERSGREEDGRERERSARSEAGNEKESRRRDDRRREAGGEHEKKPARDPQRKRKPKPQNPEKPRQGQPQHEASEGEKKAPDKSGRRSHRPGRHHFKPAEHKES